MAPRRGPVLGFVSPSLSNRQCGLTVASVDSERQLCLRQASRPVPGAASRGVPACVNHIRIGSEVACP